MPGAMDEALVKLGRRENRPEADLCPEGVAGVCHGDHGLREKGGRASAIRDVLGSLSARGQSGRLTMSSSTSVFTERERTFATMRKSRSSSVGQLETWATGEGQRATRTQPLEGEALTGSPSSHVGPSIEPSSPTPPTSSFA